LIFSYKEQEQALLRHLKEIAPDKHGFIYPSSTRIIRIFNQHFMLFAIAKDTDNIELLNLLAICNDWTIKIAVLRNGNVNSDIVTKIFLNEHNRIDLRKECLNHPKLPILYKVMF
jgi:hypothetical protein